MKLAVIATLAAGASAFAPTAQVSVSLCACVFYRRDISFSVHFFHLMRFLTYI